MINNSKIKKLSNGATLIYTKKKNNPFFSVVYGFKVGSLNENDNNRGISHFLEHMVFNGSKNYYKGQYFTLAQEYGGDMNAYTSFKSTIYELQTLKQYWKDSLDLITDLTFCAKFPEEYLEKERSIILEELSQSEDEIWSKLYEQHYSLFKYSNYKNPIIGYQNTINTITINDLKNYYNKYYTSNNLIISICTDLDFKDILNYLEFIIPNKQHKILKYKDNFDRVESYNITYKDGISHCKIFKSFLFDKKHSEYFELISQLLSGNLNSLLINELREKQGLCYQCGSVIGDLNNNTGLFNIYVSYQDKSKTDYILKEIDRIVLELSNNIMNYELQVAKTYLISSVYNTYEKSIDVSNTKLLKYLNKNELNLNKYINKINSITKENLQELIKQYYKSENIFYSILQYPDNM